MKSLEEVFIREFKDNVRLVGSKDIYSVPLPKDISRWEVSGTEEYKINGIEDEFYSKLNGTVVRRMPKGYKAARREIDKGSRTYKRDDEGKFIYKDYPVPSGSAVVSSPVNIGLPYKRYVKDIDGYGYVDYMKDKASGVMLYIYVVPKDFLYRVHQTALAISVKNMKNYQGMGYLSWNNGVIYIHVIPYNPNSQYIGSKILKTGHTVDYTKEIHLLSDYWEKVGFIPNIQYCALQNETNLVLKPTVTGYDEYYPVDDAPVGSRDIFGADTHDEDVEVE